MYIRSHPIDFRTLVQCTPLPRLWGIFLYIVSVSPVSESGLSMAGAGAYLQDCPPLNVTHSEFWGVMSYFLSRQNRKLLRKRGK